MKKILIMGLPGAGKTSFAKRFCLCVPEKLKPFVHLNADAVRKNLNKDLGFTPADRLEQARRMGWLADLTSSSGILTVTDFICPFSEGRKLFSPDVIFFLNTIQKSRFAMDDSIFQPPTSSESQLFIQFDSFNEVDDFSISRFIDENLL